MGWIWRGGYLLRLHGRVAVYALHLAVHLRLWGAIRGSLAGLDLRGIHARLLAVVLLGGKAVAAEGVVWWWHGLVGGMAWLLWDVLLGKLGGAGAGAGDTRCASLARGPLCVGRLFTRHDIDKEIKHVGFGQRGCDV